MKHTKLALFGGEKVITKEFEVYNSIVSIGRMIMLDTFWW